MAINYGLLIYGFLFVSLTYLLCNSYLIVFGVGVSSRILYSFVGYIYVSGSGSIISLGEERANLSAIVNL